jgi:hypothetical protein
VLARASACQGIGVIRLLARMLARLPAHVLAQCKRFCGFLFGMVSGTHTELPRHKTTPCHGQIFRDRQFWVTEVTGYRSYIRYKGYSLTNDKFDFKANLEVY